MDTPRRILAYIVHEWRDLGLDGRQRRASSYLADSSLNVEVRVTG